MQNLLTAKEVQGMVTHWIGTPPNGYLGQDYGSDTHAMLAQPMSTPAADDYLAKMNRDIPILAELPSGSVNVVLSERYGSKEAKDLSIDIGGTLIPLATPQDLGRKGR